MALMNRQLLAVSHRDSLDSPTETARPRQPGRDSPAETARPRQPDRDSPAETALVPHQQTHIPPHPHQQPASQSNFVVIFSSTPFYRIARTITCLLRCADSQTFLFLFCSTPSYTEQHATALVFHRSINMSVFSNFSKYSACVDKYSNAPKHTRKKDF